MKRRMGRWRRRLGFDANDLRRDVDRTQWRIGLVLLMVFLSVTPPLALNVAERVYESGERAERRAAEAWRRVDATVVKISEVRTGHQITVTWTEPDGTRRDGAFTSPSRAAVGARVPAWVSDGAVAAAPPQRHGLTVIDTVAAGMGVVLAMGLSLLGLHMLVRRRCDRHRDRLWDAAWARFDNHRIGP